METTNWTISQNYWDYQVENVLFTYDESEQEQNKINNNNANLVLKPRFVPLYPKLLQEWYWLMESVLFWFITFFIDTNDRFYCTNEQLAQLFNCSTQTISTAIKSLESRWDIVLHKKIRAGGWTIRFITLGNQKIWFWEVKKSHQIDNKIIENNNIIINNNTEFENSEFLENNNSLSINNLDLKEKEKSCAKKEKEITVEINNLLEQIKNTCNELWVAYDKTKDRMFAKHILTAKEYWEFCESIKQDRVEFALNILKASVVINYWKWPLTWTMKIYQNYADVYNQTKQKSQKFQNASVDVL